MIESLRDRLKLANSFCLYYGYGCAEQLAKYDVAIIDEKTLDPIEIQAVKDNGTLLIGYISVMELINSDSFQFELEDTDFLWVDNKKLINETYHTFLINLRSEKWIERIQKQIYEMLNSQKFDGIFLDTIGDVEGLRLPKHERNIQLMSAVQLIAGLRRVYPHHIFIQNNGLEMLCDYTAPLIDGVCWENPLFTNQWTEQIKTKLVNIQDKWGLKVFLLFEESVENALFSYKKTKQWERNYKWLTYYASFQYISGVNKPDLINE